MNKNYHPDQVVVKHRSLKLVILTLLRKNPILCMATIATWKQRDLPALYSARNCWHYRSSKSKNSRKWEPGIQIIQPLTYRDKKIFNYHLKDIVKSVRRKQVFSSAINTLISTKQHLINKQKRNNILIKKPSIRLKAVMRFK